jgi:hypothetical protein
VTSRGGEPAVCGAVLKRTPNADPATWAWGRNASLQVIGVLNKTQSLTDFRRGMVVANEGFNIQAGAETSPFLKRLSASKNGRRLRRVCFTRDKIMDIFI